MLISLIFGPLFEKDTLNHNKHDSTKYDTVIKKGKANKSFIPVNIDSEDSTFINYKDSYNNFKYTNEKIDYILSEIKRIEFKINDEMSIDDLEKISKEVDFIKDDISYVEEKYQYDITDVGLNIKNELKQYLEKIEKIDTKIKKLKQNPRLKESFSKPIEIESNQQDTKEKIIEQKSDYNENKDYSLKEKNKIELPCDKKSEKKAKKNIKKGIENGQREYKKINYSIKNSNKPADDVDNKIDKNDNKEVKEIKVIISNQKEKIINEKPSITKLQNINITNKKEVKSTVSYNNINDENRVIINQNINKNVNVETISKINTIISKTKILMSTSSLLTKYDFSFFKFQLKINSNLRKIRKKNNKSVKIINSNILIRKTKPKIVKLQIEKIMINNLKQISLLKRELLMNYSKKDIINLLLELEDLEAEIKTKFSEMTKQNNEKYTKIK